MADAVIDPVRAAARRNVCDNYRRLYREKYGAETSCSDADIIRCWSANFCAPSSIERDDWTLEDMHGPVSLSKWLDDLHA